MSGRLTEAGLALWEARRAAVREKNARLTAISVQLQKDEIAAERRIQLARAMARQEEAAVPTATNELSTGRSDVLGGRGSPQPTHS